MEFILPEAKNFPQAAEGISIGELKVIKNNLMKALSKIFGDAQNKIGGGIGFRVRPYIKEAEIIISAHEKGAVKIAHKKRDELKKIFKSIPIKVTVEKKTTEL